MLPYYTKDAHTGSALKPFRYQCEAWRGWRPDPINTRECDVWVASEAEFLRLLDYWNLQATISAKQASCEMRYRYSRVIY